MIISLIDFFFVFQSVCGRLKEWMEQGKEILPVSVNFSGASLRNRSFVEQPQKSAAMEFWKSIWR